jgi:hypothetical protein
LASEVFHPSAVPAAHETDGCAAGMPFCAVAAESW